MSRLNINNLTNENEDGSPRISGISTFSSTHYFVPPSGSTAERPSHADPGMIRFNTDSGHLEYYNGVEWTSVIVNNQELDGGNRGVFAGGNTTPLTTEINIIEYVTISTLGNSVDFGDFASGTARRVGACASRTRGLLGGGYRAPAYSNVIDYVTISSTGNTQDYGDLTQERWSLVACSSSTRGLFGGGYTGGVNYDIIDYVTIDSTGNAVDFGNLTRGRRETASFSSSVRGVWGGGRSPVPSGVNNNENIIDYVTILSTGNAIDFGDLSAQNTASAGSSNSTRGIFLGGFVGPVSVNTIEFITIATTGNSQDFGDLNQTLYTNSSCSSSTRALTIGGTGGPTPVNIIEYVTILTTGNSLDFGDIVGGVRQETGACSNGHGGL